MQAEEADLQREVQVGHQASRATRALVVPAAVRSRLLKAVLLNSAVVQGLLPLPMEDLHPQAVVVRLLLDHQGQVSTRDAALRRQVLLVPATVHQDPIRKCRSMVVVLLLPDQVDTTHADLLRASEDRHRRDLQEDTIPEALRRLVPRVDLGTIHDEGLLQDLWADLRPPIIYGKVPHLSRTVGLIEGSESCEGRQFEMATRRILKG